MDKLFIDTNVFESKGFNFDKRNILIKVLTDNIKDKKYEYNSLSVIDNEIISHISENCYEEEHLLNKKYKWLKNIVNEKIIHDNCYKNLLDYEQFKKDCNSIQCDVSHINAESVFKKYFAIKLPFELKKRKEFCDGFISEYLNLLVKKMNANKIYFISNDNGLKKSLNNSIKKYSTIEEFLKEVNGMDPEKYSFIKEIIRKNIINIGTKILEYLSVDCIGIEEEEIKIDEIKLSNEFEIELMDASNNEFYVNCTFKKISLVGNFTCLDYDNSYWPNDEMNYTYKEYLESSEIDYNNYEVSLKIKKLKDDYTIDYNNIYHVEINYEKMKKYASGRFSPYDDYDGEDNWSQDGGPWR